MTEFKQFKMGDIFCFSSSKKIYHAKNIHVLNDPVSSDWYRYVVRSSKGNGIRGYINQDISGLNPAHTISLAQDTAEFFYQDKPYFTGNKIKVLSLNAPDVKLNPLLAQYLVTVMKKSFGAFGWSSSFNVSILKSISINLPVQSQQSTEPDWDYMEKTIQKTEAPMLNAVSDWIQQKNIQLSDTEIDTILKRYNKVKFSDFRIGELFTDIKQGSRLKSSDQISGEIPFVSSGFVNMGISNYISNPLMIMPANSLTIDIFGNVFYRDQEYTISDDVGSYWNSNGKTLSQSVMQYLQTSIQKSLIGKFSYAKKLRATKSLNLTCKLPTTPSGTPDYTLMEDYIKVIQQKYVRNLESQLHERISIAKTLV